MTRCSRAVHSASFAADGATADTPMNGAPGMRTPGICAEVAQPSAICQCTRNGSVITSRRKPSPGMIALNAVGWAMMSVNSISSMSPGSAPLTKTGPVSGCTTPASSDGKIGAGHARLDLAVERVARLQRDLLAFADLGDRCDVGMVAVVADMRLVGERLCPIDADRMHGGPCAASSTKIPGFPAIGVNLGFVGNWGNAIRSQPPRFGAKSPGGSLLSAGTRCVAFREARLCRRCLSHLTRVPVHAGAGGARSLAMSGRISWNIRAETTTLASGK